MTHVPRNIQAPFTATDFWTQWNSTTPRMALFIKITPQSFWSSVSPVGLTSNTRDMTLPGHPGITFKSAPGITPTAVEQILDEAANLEMTGIYQTGAIEQEDVVAGKWNFGTIEVWSQSWEHPEYGELLHAKCKTGEIKDYQTYFVAEARGYMSLLSNDVNKVTSRFCRVKEFGDAECGKDLNDTVDIDGDTYEISQTGLVVVSSGGDGELIDFDNTNWVGTFPAHDTLFRNGKVTMTSGANAGVSREISETTGVFPGMRLGVKRHFPFEVQAGETFDLVAGCDRTIENCMRYENIANRRAEDWVPTVEVVHRIPPSS